jgi:hypothetical protein
LINLVGNALKFTSHGFIEVSLRSRPQQEPPREVGGGGGGGGGGGEPIAPTTTTTTSTSTTPPSPSPAHLDVPPTIHVLSDQPAIDEGPPTTPTSVVSVDSESALPVVGSFFLNFTLFCFYFFMLCYFMYLCSVILCYGDFFYFCYIFIFILFLFFPIMSHNVTLCLSFVQLLIRTFWKHKSNYESLFLFFFLFF